MEISRQKSSLQDKICHAFFPTFLSMNLPSAPQKIVRVPRSPHEGTGMGTGEPLGKEGCQGEPGVAWQDQGRV